MKYIALLTFGSFCVLASYCYGTVAPHQKVVAKPVILWRTVQAEAQAAALADIWGIRPDDLESAADIFGERKRP